MELTNELFDDWTHRAKSAAGIHGPRAKLAMSAEAILSLIAAARRGLEQRWVPVVEGDLVRELTECMREADRVFERVGGSTRHHVRDCLIPELEKAGLVVVRALPSPPEAK